MRASQHRWGALPPSAELMTHAGRPVPSDLRPHCITVTQDSAGWPCPAPLSRNRFKVEILIFVNKLLWG
jgi:hypothetical protein